MRAFKKLTDDQIVETRSRLALGHYQHNIAADFGVNQGRIAEVKSGHTLPSWEIEVD